MSILDNQEFKRTKFSKFDDVFATGVYLSPVEIDGQWRWIATMFEDDTFWSGDSVDVKISADTPEGLVEFYTEEDIIGTSESEKE